MGDWLYFHVEIQKTIANVLNVVLDCRVHCSNRKTGIQSLKIMYDCCIMLSVQNPHCLRWGVVRSVNYNKDARNDNRVFNTEILISDFNEGMNIGMVQKNGAINLDGVRWICSPRI